MIEKGLQRVNFPRLSVTPDDRCRIKTRQSAYKAPIRPSMPSLFAERAVRRANDRMAAIATGYVDALDVHGFEAAAAWQASLLSGVEVLARHGDQQAALFGQACLQPGQASAQGLKRGSEHP